MGKLLKTAIISVCIIFLILLIPDFEPTETIPSNNTAFLWNQDEYWSGLENSFNHASDMDSLELANLINSHIRDIDSGINSFIDYDIDPSSLILSKLENAIFETSPLVAANPKFLPELISIHNKVRFYLKEESRNWDMNSTETRNRLYRLLYGSRIAIEEIILQTDANTVPALSKCYDEPSATPSAEIQGVTVHSGDILVSRGGAPTSALIARGNDYPGNFSHVALVYVDNQSRETSIVEAHIEIGVAIASVEKYLHDTKLRIMVLRLRADHPAIIDDPTLPHKAAKMAYNRALNEHIPYDFAMDFNDDSKLFCSEVASAPYAKLGITLWMGISKISTPGVRSWLAALGVKHFETQEPSDLEYDPQLRVIAEWHDPETLYKDHLDNAVIDIMLEAAENGERLDYQWYKLPLARIAKGYSMIKNMWNGVGPIPEGMSATSALKVDNFSKQHNAIKEKLIKLADDFKSRQGYNPPYWELVKLARIAKEKL